MKCKVLKRFKAWPRSGPNIARDFDVGDILENIEVAREMAAFEPHGSTPVQVYQLRKDHFDEVIACA